MPEFEPVVWVALIGVAGTLLAGPVTQSINLWVEGRREKRLWEREDRKETRREVGEHLLGFICAVDDFVDQVSAARAAMTDPGEDRHVQDRGRVLGTAHARIQLWAGDDTAKAAGELYLRAIELVGQKDVTHEYMEARTAFYQAARPELGSTS